MSGRQNTVFPYSSPQGLPVHETTTTLPSTPVVTWLVELFLPSRWFPKPTLVRMELQKPNGFRSFKPMIRFSLVAAFERPGDLQRKSLPKTVTFLKTLLDDNQFHLGRLAMAKHLAGFPYIQISDSHQGETGRLRATIPNHWRPGVDKTNTISCHVEPFIHQ